MFHLIDVLCKSHFARVLHWHFLCAFEPFGSCKESFLFSLLDHANIYNCFVNSGKRMLWVLKVLGEWSLWWQTMAQLGLLLPILPGLQFVLSLAVHCPRIGPKALWCHLQTCFEAAQSSWLLAELSFFLPHPTLFFLLFPLVSSVQCHALLIILGIPTCFPWSNFTKTLIRIFSVILLHLSDCLLSPNVQMASPITKSPAFATCRASSTSTIVLSQSMGKHCDTFKESRFGCFSDSLVSS